MRFDLQPTLKGEFPELRPLQPSDFDALFAVASDPGIWEQHPAKERAEPDGFRKFLEDALDSGGALIAHDRRDSRVIGSSRFFGYDRERSEVEIGWTFLARSHWGGRYNGEIKRLMLDHAFRFVDCVVFLVAPENYRSLRAVEKVGGVRTGTCTNAAGSESVLFELRTPQFRTSADGMMRSR